MWGPFSRLGATVAALTFVLDQAHKWWMLDVVRIQGQGRVPVLPFLDWQFMLNTGVSFSMFDRAGPTWQLTLTAFAVLAATVMWVWLSRADTTRVMAAGLALIIGGALGNAVDRVRHGGVIDYFLPHAFGVDWPNIFNIADVAIVAGVALLLYDCIVPSRNDAANSL
jgi:signal peptidase II